MRPVDADEMDVEKLCDADYWSSDKVYRSDVQRMIDNAPTIQFKPHHANWVKDCYGNFRCTHCDSEAIWKYNGYQEISNYCPDCGYAMHDWVGETTCTGTGDSE